MELCMYTVQMLCPGRRIIAPWVTLAEGLTLNSCAQRYLNRLEETYWSRDRGLWQTERLWGTGCPSSLSCRHKTWAQPWVMGGQVGRMHLGGNTVQHPTGRSGLHSLVQLLPASLGNISHFAASSPCSGRIASMQWPLYHLPNCDDMPMLKAPSGNTCNFFYLHCVKTCHTTPPNWPLR